MRCVAYLDAKPMRLAAAVVTAALAGLLLIMLGVAADAVVGEPLVAQILIGLGTGVLVAPVAALLAAWIDPREDRRLATGDARTVIDGTQPEVQHETRWARFVASAASLSLPAQVALFVACLLGVVVGVVAFAGTL